MPARQPPCQAAPGRTPRRASTPWPACLSAVHSLARTAWYTCVQPCSPLLLGPQVAGWVRPRAASPEHHDNIRQRQRSTMAMNTATSGRLADAHAGAVRRNAPLTGSARGERGSQPARDTTSPVPVASAPVSISPNADRRVCSTHRRQPRARTRRSNRKRPGGAPARAAPNGFRKPAFSVSVLTRPAARSSRTRTAAMRPGGRRCLKITRDSYAAVVRWAVGFCPSHGTYRMAWVATFSKRGRRSCHRGTCSPDLDGWAWRACNPARMRCTDMDTGCPLYRYRSAALSSTGFASASGVSSSASRPCREIP